MGTTGDRETLHIFYDGSCRLCLASVKRLKELRSSAELLFIPLQSLDGDAARLYPAVAALPKETLAAKMHVADGEGRLYAGADGIVRILRTVPGFRLLAPLYRLPGMKRAMDALYRYIANRRYEWFGEADESCESGACALPVRNEPKEGG
ncbi:thiol-disulfide oxidoreductase DCC family protein [Paenibacillus humicola]|uniref:thiol-disulfide oxidoreductase DCC family protein n=1 Tax=Paenibacillus humicola TaxID=3110540 RepID=UPI00237BFE1E|nr:DUF393 domain-containing protein [Paenibacillus humicola]